MSGAAQVVIVGGGYVGLDAYRALMRRLGRQVKRGQVQITVVSPLPYHTFHGFTGEGLGELVPLAHTLTPLPPLMPHARYLQGTVTRVDAQRQQVEVHSEEGQVQLLTYEHLILGVGSVDPFDRLPGLREHGRCLKDARDMRAFRAELHARFQARQPTTINVIGGGYAGVEMAAALRERQQREGLGGEIHLLSSGPVLETLGPALAPLAAHARQSLQGLGVQLHEGVRIREVTSGGAHAQDDRFFPADLTLFAAGIAPAVLPGTEAMRHPHSGRLLTDQYMRVPGHTNIWTGGDAAHVAHPKRPGDCPVNALWAMKHGMCAGNNVARSLRGQPLRPFAYGGLGQSASLGHFNGITELLGLQFKGPVAWVLRLAFFAWYMPSKRQGVRVVADLLWRRPRAMQGKAPVVPTSAAP
ncbi:NAD(P)/FAD-dependent oxidoreductase [Deinococcus multiflagellatus]|uniref:NAD(P)/FAD-dependent oxidoreductase n=1 Tax=Deinococcus multiflagellatus TaxID=1656887 RepID=A0ABW1ZF25_9DEIO|nr:FAD-dependent oxidoreductase [Deinococcus multiflagellatus]MBZ9712124.1 FAD-dependent oxidoreductase [Deinococcus multiflagellatus]